MCCRYDFDIPILALDLVAAGGSVTLAIIDVCPVTPRLNLPQHYTQTMMELQHNFLPGVCVGGGGQELGCAVVRLAVPCRTVLCCAAKSPRIFLYHALSYGAARSPAQQ